MSSTPDALGVPDEAGAAAGMPAAVPDRRERFSTQVRRSVQDRTRASVRGMRLATGRDYSLAQLVEDALERHCAELEGHYNDGRPWPLEPRRPLPPGRQ